MRSRSRPHSARRRLKRTPCQSCEGRSGETVRSHRPTFTRATCVCQATLGLDAWGCLVAATTIVLLDNPVRSYAWGSREVLARLSGRPVPSAEPELWIGAHPTASSRLGAGGPRLDDEIRWDRLPILGSRLLGAFGPELPFLMKILAVERPLSFQVHPNAEQARARFCP